MSTDALTFAGGGSAEMSLGPEGVALPASALGKPPGVSPDRQHREASVGQFKGLRSTGARHADRHPAGQRDLADVIDGVSMRARYRIQAWWQAHGYGQVARADVGAGQAPAPWDGCGGLHP